MSDYAVAMTKTASVPLAEPLVAEAETRGTNVSQACEEGLR